MKKHIYIIAVFFLISAAVLWIGCSDSDTTVSSSSNSGPDVSTYFPLKTGCSLQFMEINNVYNDTTIHLFTTGTSIIVGGRQVYAWTEEVINRPASIDTGYLFYEGDALYYFESPYDIPEKLLNSPLEVGSVWLRYDASQVQIDDVGDIDILSEFNNGKGDINDGVQGGFIGGGSGDDNNGPDVKKCFPTTGSNYFTLTAIEDLIFEDGNRIEECLKIENNVSGASNYYWYAPGVGLVKYIIGVDSEDYPEGEVVGQIVSTGSM